MLRKTFRITPRSRVGYVLKKGAHIRGRFFRVSFLLNRLSTPRFAVIVSKKVSTSAVIRNKLKRRTHEALAANWQHTAGLWYDVAVLVSPQALDAAYELLAQDLLLCLKKLSIQKN